MKGSTVLLLAVLAGLFLMNQKAKAAPAVTVPVDKVTIAPVTSAVVPPMPEADPGPELKWFWDGTAWVTRPIGVPAWTGGGIIADPGYVFDMPPIDLVRGGVMWPGGDAPGSGGPEDPLGPSNPNWKYRPVLLTSENSGIMGAPVTMVM